MSSFAVADIHDREKRPLLPGSLKREEFLVGAYRMSGSRLAEVLIGRKERRGLRYAGSARLPIAGLGRQLFQLLRMLRIHTSCPFSDISDLPMKGVDALAEQKLAQCQWVEATVRVWVEHEGCNTAGHLVNPRVVAMN